MGGTQERRKRGEEEVGRGGSGEGRRGRNNRQLVCVLPVHEVWEETQKQVVLAFGSCYLMSITKVKTQDQLFKTNFTGLFIYCLHVCLCEGDRSTGTGATDICELPSGCWEQNPGPPEEQSVLLTPAPCRITFLIPNWFLSKDMDVSVLGLTMITQETSV